MKLLATVLILLLFPLSIFAQCKSGNIIKGCKDDLKPFRYTGFARNDIILDDRIRRQEVEFTALKGQMYRLVFCTSGNYEENVIINIYDKSRNVPTRNRLFSNEDTPGSNKWIFDPKKTGTFFIEYEIPPSKDGSKKEGCLLVLIGYIEVD